VEQRDRIITIQDIETIVGRLFIQLEMLREEVVRLERELTEARKLKGGEDDIETRTSPQHSPRAG